MQKPATNADLSPATLERARGLFAAHQQTIYQHTDRLFAVLMAVQWGAGIAAALWISPRTWIGSVSQTHVHVWAAIILGGLINIFPIVLAIKKPGAATTRYTIATAQMMMSALLIYLTGGRIETHFHVFGSLAFLAFYRDWRVLLPATVVVAADHFLRGVFWPESVYGVLSVSQWRWLEHAGWVLFEDAVLYVAIKRSVAEMWDIAVRTAQTNDLNQSLEQRVAERTAEIVSINFGLQKEIAERELAEDALQASEREHRSIFDNATMGIYRSTVDGTIVKANDAFAKMLGYDSVEEIMGCDLGRDVYFYPEQRARLIAEREETGGVADGLEILWKKKDGTPTWVHLNARAVKDEAGNTLCFDTCIHDVTERVQAEESLRGSERRFSQAFNASPQPMSIATLNEGRYIDVNESFAAVSGYGRAELIDHTSAEVSIWPTNEARQSFVDLLLDHGSVRNIETQLRTKSGELRVLLSSAEVVEIDQERCLLIASSDITERKQAEQALQEANERALTEYESLVERIATLGQTLGNARDLTAIFRSLRDFTVVSAPCDGMAISLYDPEKATRKPAYCWIDDAEFDPGQLVAVQVDNGMTGQAIRTSTVIIDNDFQQQLSVKPATTGNCSNGRTPHSALVAPMTVMGRTVGCVEIQSYQLNAYGKEHTTAMRMAANLAATAVENVTLIEREHSKEEQLRQSQKMEVVGQLAGGVAHDFNNLLTAITGYSDLTLRDLDANHPVRPKIVEIKKAGERAASLTRQLLAFSRKQILQPKVLDLNAIIPEMKRMLQRLIGEDIVLETSLDGALGQVKADPGQIEQIIMNLSINARDAMPQGGRLTIETRNVHLQQAYTNQQVLLRPGHYVMLTVSDSGCGMDAETQAHIFEPFFTTKDLGKGTGLGLSTVYGIVKQSEGSIWVYSEVDRGTTFKIYLPRVDDVAESAAIAGGLKAIPRGNETILLVEDEEIVRVLSTDILERQGYTVITAEDGEAGLRVCKEFDGRIDLMITDVVMPHMSGRELAERVAILRPSTQVLYMSGFTDDAIVRHGVLDEGVFFIQKPFSPDSLALKAREVLDQPGLQMEPALASSLAPETVTTA